MRNARLFAHVYALFTLALHGSSIESTYLEILNEAKAPIIVYWVNDENGDLIPLTDSVAPMNIAGIDTYAGHTFKIMEAGSTTGLLFTKAATKEKIAIGYMDNIGLTLSHRYDIREIGSPRDSRNKTTSGLQPLREYTPSTITLMIENNTTNTLEVFWKRDKPLNELISMGVIAPDKSFAMDSFDSHNFLIALKGETSNGLDFTKSGYDETLTVYLQENGSLELEVHHPFDLMESLLEKALEACPDQTHSMHASCITAQTYAAMVPIFDHNQAVKSYRDQIADKLRNYTCADESLPTSTPKSSAVEFIYGKEYTVHTYLNMEMAKIWAVPDFVTDEECNLLMEHGRPRLQRAAVVGADGLGEISESRKAQQAGYNIEDENDPLWNLYHRVLNFTNSHSDYDLHHEGQEYFTIIQYNMEDEYTNHCDGVCDGSAHVPTGRVATAVLYCQVPERGGATTFTKADVFIRPVRGSATFFSYMGGPEQRMDVGFTEHSGCPVFEGEKWITTAWMRKGVTKEHNSELYEPSGKRIVLADESGEEIDSANGAN